MERADQSDLGAGGHGPEEKTGEMSTHPPLNSSPLRRSQNIDLLMTALAKAQGLMEAAKREALNPHFKHKYAELSSVWDAIREPLSSNGISVYQAPVSVPNVDAVRIVTLLGHSSGQWIESDYDMPAPRWDPQGVGTAITYGRRYALMAAVGIAPEDDDGEAATQAVREEQHSERPKPVASDKANRVRGETWTCVFCGVSVKSDDVKMQMNARRDDLKTGVRKGQLIYLCDKKTGGCGQFSPARGREPGEEPEDERLPDGFYTKEELEARNAKVVETEEIGPYTG